MNRKKTTFPSGFRWSFTAALLVSFTAMFLPVSQKVSAQQLQIPTLQVCNPSMAYGEARVLNTQRKSLSLPGFFYMRLKVECDPVNGDGYPYGNIEFAQIRLTDSDVVPYMFAKTIEQVSTVGRATPIIWIRGQCASEQSEIVGCRYWLMISDNRRMDEKGTPDIVSLIVFDKYGVRRIYITGEVVAGDLYVAPGV